MAGYSWFVILSATKDLIVTCMEGEILGGVFPEQKNKILRFAQNDQ